jgi:hypothetical protein
MTERKRRKNSWPLFILLLGACFLALTGWSVQKAVSESSPPVEIRR